MNLKECLFEIVEEWNKTHDTKIPMEFITFVLVQVIKRSNNG